MDYLVAFLLGHCDWHADLAFVQLVALMKERKYRLGELYKKKLPLLQVAFFQLRRLCIIHLPQLYAHLDEEGIDLSMFSASWFITLFTNFNYLPPDVVAMFFDQFVLDGWKAVFRVALALLKQAEPTLMERGMEEILEFFQHYDWDPLEPGGPKESFGGGRGLMQAARTFKVTTTILDTLEQEYEAELHKRTNRRFTA